MRLFVAFTPPPEVRAALAALKTGELIRARWVDAARIHATLRFVGSVDASVLGELEAALELVRSPPIAVRCVGVGAFGRPPRVVWVGLEPAAPLTALAGQIDAAVQAAGLPPADQPFRPHLTLARLKGAPPHQVRRFVAETAVDLGPFVVDRFELVESRLSQAGPEYRVVRGFGLG